MKDNSLKVGVRNWFIFIIIGFAGQLAWSLENMYLNSFLFDLGYENYQAMITWTEALSAITACITTIIMGGLTDKVGRRKIFITVGYLLWGVSTAAFGLINVKNVSTLFPAVAGAQLASIFVIIIDCIMTFFGSTSNDASFNAYVTRNVKDTNRGKVEGVLSVLPLMSMLLITVLYGFTGKNHWDYFFYIVGGFVFLIGIIAFFLIPKETVDPKEEKYIRLVFEGFKPSVIKANPMLYIILIADFIYCAASQIVFPYMIIYFNKTLGFVETDYLILLGTVLIVGSLLSVIAGFLLDKVDKIKMMIPWSLIYIAGLVLLFFVNKGNLIFAVIAGTLMMFGYIICATVINSLVRDYTPKDKEGVFQGVRMVFQVALPMVTGPYIAQVIVNNLSNETYINDFNVTQKLPPKWIWLFGAGVFTLIFIPIIILIIKNHKIHKLDNKGLLYDQTKED
jgi:Major Facilitator Superfamily.